MRARLIGLLRLPIEIVLTLFVVLDEVARPIYRPLLRWVATWGVMERFQAWVADQQRLVILILLIVPFAIVEPLKILALVWIGRGAAVPGVITLALAYLAGFVLVERVYTAGKPKLMTIRWFAWLMGLIITVREAVLGWVRASALWRGIDATRRRIRSFFRPGE